MRIRLLDIKLDVMTQSELTRVVFNAIRSREQTIIGNHNLHSIFLFQKDSKFRKFYEIAHTVHIDGMFLVYLARLFGFRVNSEHRVTYVDWIYPLMEESARLGWKIFYLGGRVGVADIAAEKLKQMFPKLHLKTHHGYFEKTGEENKSLVEMINLNQPDILLVGMGMPVQEYWILDNHFQLCQCVILEAGACFDYVAGNISTPPRWMGNAGLEWLYRLATEPQRLWKRYLLEPWYVLILVLKELFR